MFCSNSKWHCLLNFPPEHCSDTTLRIHVPPTPLNVAPLPTHRVWIEERYSEGYLAWCRWPSDSLQLDGSDGSFGSRKNDTSQHSQLQKSERTRHRWKCLHKWTSGQEMFTSGWEMLSSVDIRVGNVYIRVGDVFINGHSVGKCHHQWTSTSTSTSG